MADDCFSYRAENISTMTWRLYMHISNLMVLSKSLLPSRTAKLSIQVSSRI